MDKSRYAFVIFLLEIVYYLGNWNIILMIFEGIHGKILDYFSFFDYNFSEVIVVASRRKRNLIALSAYAIILSSIVGCSASEEKGIANANNMKDDNGSSAQMVDENREEAVIINDSQVEQEFDGFTAEKMEIRKLINEEKWEEAKLKAKETLIKGIDFIFYGKDINGVTWGDLKEESKKVTLENLSIIDGWIMEIFPNYKEEIGDKYNSVKSFMSDVWDDAKGYVYDHVSDETLNRISSFKESASESMGEVGDMAKETYDKGKSRVKSWYENFRNGN